MRKNIFIMIFCIIILSSLVVAVKPVTSEIIFTGNTGLRVEVNSFEYYKYGEARWAIIHVFNETSGYQFTPATSDINCSVHLRDSQGFELAEIMAVPHLDHWDINGSLGANNPVGHYAYTLICTDDTMKTGGFVSGFFFITESGISEQSDSFYIVFVLLVLLIFFIYCAMSFEDELKFVFIILSFMMIMFILNVLGQIVNTTVNVALINLIWFAYTMSIYLFWAMVLYVLYKLTFELKIKKNPPPRIDSPLKVVKHNRKVKNGYKHKR